MRTSERERAEEEEGEREKKLGDKKNRNREKERERKREREREEKKCINGFFSLPSLVRMAIKRNFNIYRSTNNDQIGHYRRRDFSFSPTFCHLSRKMCLCMCTYTYGN